MVIGKYIMKFLLLMVCFSILYVVVTSNVAFSADRAPAILMTKPISLLLIQKQHKALHYFETLKIKTNKKLKLFDKLDDKLIEHEKKEIDNVADKFYKEWSIKNNTIPSKLHSRGLLYSQTSKFRPKSNTNRIVLNSPPNSAMDGASFYNVNDPNCPSLSNVSLMDTTKWINPVLNVWPELRLP